MGPKVEASQVAMEAQIWEMTTLVDFFPWEVDPHDLDLPICLARCLDFQVDQEWI